MSHQSSSEKGNLLSLIISGLGSILFYEILHTYTHMHRTMFQAQTNLPGVLLKNYRAGKLQVLKSEAVSVLQMDREMSQIGKGSNF